MRPDPAAVIQAFALPVSDRELVALTPEDRAGAVWRLGDYAVKRVRWDVPDWWRIQAEVGADFERRAFEAGVRCPEPVHPGTAGIGYCTVIDGAPYRVHRFVASDGVGSQEVDDWISATLSTLHALVPADAPDEQEYGKHSVDDWEGWIEEGRSQARPWAPSASQSLGLITEATDVVDAALRACRRFAVCHRDFNPWNVRVTDVPWLIDFDHAGADNPFLEAVSTVMEFAFVGREEPDEERIDHMLGRYVDAGGVVEALDGSPVLSRWIGSKLMWIAWNMWRSLGYRLTTQVERDEADRIVTQELSTFPDLVRDVEGWSRLFRV